MHIRCLFFLGLLVAAVPVAGDSITIDGVTHENVYITESASRFYIQFPSTGQTKSMAKADVDAESVRLSEDHSARQALLREWEGNTDAPGTQPETPAKAQPVSLSDAAGKPETGRAPSAVPPPHAPPLSAAPAPLSPTSATREDYVTDGYVRPVKLDDVELGHALDALLRPLNLDYEPREGHMWISTGERIRREPSERLEVRVYQLNHAGGEILPKVGVSNFGGPGYSGGSYGRSGGNVPGGRSLRR